MKKTGILIGLLVNGFFCAYSQQAGDTLSLIAQKWNIRSIDDSVYNLMDSAEKEDFKKAVITFTSDGNYISSIGNKEAERGTWKYLPDKRKLVCKSAINKSTVIIIQSITENEIKGQTYADNEKERFGVVLSAIK
ncbi:MAG: hypothetical protein Q8941_09625 [Bacteroidota bacterium]|nr:hypothetical protein [Bacteroidota bacterium]